MSKEAASMPFLGGSPLRYDDEELLNSFMSQPMHSEEVSASLAMYNPHAMVPTFGSSMLGVDFGMEEEPHLGVARSASASAKQQALRAKPIPVKSQVGSPPIQGSLEASSSGDGNTMPDFGSREDGDAGTADDMRRHREKNRAAQKRFRLRQKARMATSAQQVAELASQMEALMQEKQHLESQNRVLQHTVQLSTRHFSEVLTEKEAYRKQAENIMMETAQIYWRGTNSPPMSLEEAKAVTMEDFIGVFEHFLGRYRAMLEAGGKDINSPAGKELHDTVLDRRQEEARAAMFSDWASAALAWNKEEMNEGMRPPSVTFWTQILAGLELTLEQQQGMLRARRRLLNQLTSIRQQREKIVLALGLALLRKSNGSGPSPEEKQLRASSEAEREAVLDFLFQVVDSTLMPWQEAYLDVSAYPWWPDLWAICNILASRQKNEPADSSIATAGAAGLLPQFSAFEMLVTPILARGAGLQLKRGLASHPTPENVLEAAAKPPPTIARMRTMTMCDLMCGKHLLDESEADVKPSC